MVKGKYYAWKIYYLEILFELSFHFETFKGEKKRRRQERVVSKDFFQKLMIRIGSRNKLVIAKIESRVV